MAEHIMKKLLTILLSFLLAGMVAACTSVSENAVSLTPTETPKPEQIPESPKTPESEDTSDPGTLRVSYEEKRSNVQVYHVADNSFNQPELVPYKVVDLNDLEVYHEFVDPYQELEGLYDISTRIIFMPDTPVKDFRYLEIETTFEEELGMITVDTLYQLDLLTPAKPFVVNWISIGDIGMFRGVSFIDENGTTRYFSFNISGNDGDINFIEFKPE